MLDRDSGRLLWRAAARIHDALLAQRNHLTDDLALCSDYQELGTIVRRMQFANAHGWRKSLLGQAQDYERHCRSIVDHLQHRRQWLRESLHQPPVVPAREIWQDLLALHHEFPEVTCDLKAGTLTVITETQHALNVHASWEGDFGNRLGCQEAPLRNSTRQTRPTRKWKAGNQTSRRRYPMASGRIPGSPGPCDHSHATVTVRYSAMEWDQPGFREAEPTAQK